MMERQFLKGVVMSFFTNRYLCSKVNHLKPNH